MTPAGRAMRLRILAVQEKALVADLAKTRAKIRELENAASDALGFRVPIRGPRLFAEIERAGKKVANG